jgi:hypothetical protein
VGFVEGLGKVEVSEPFFYCAFDLGVEIFGEGGFGKDGF